MPKPSNGPRMQNPMRINVAHNGTLAPDWHVY